MKIEDLEAKAFGMTSTVSETPAVMTMETLQPALDIMREHKRQEEEFKKAFLKLNYETRAIAIASAHVDHLNRVKNKEVPSFARNTAKLLLEWHEEDVKRNKIEDQKPSPKPEPDPHPPHDYPCPLCDTKN